MRVGVIGSRGFNDYELLSKVMDEMSDEITLIVSGGAKGADSLGEKWAHENEIEVLIFYPNWDKYGKRAGFIRNEYIVKNSDLVIGFWDGQSKGTKSSFDLCKKHGIPFQIVYYNEPKRSS